jgi:hypothetical protein
MSESGEEVEKLLREVLRRQGGMESTLEAVHEQAKKTNGRVTALERAADVEKALEKERARVLGEQAVHLREVASRRQWRVGLMVGLGGSLVITILTWVGAHVG